MSTYKQIAGTTVKAYTTNPSDPQEGEMWYNQTTLKLRGVTAEGAWSSTAPALNGGSSSIGFGVQTAAVIAGGATTPGNQSYVEEYNGSGFSSATVMPAVRQDGAGAGTETAGLVWCGEGSGKLNTTIEYDGSSWTSTNTYPITARGVRGSGTQTAAIGLGGDTPAPAASNVSAEYNGSTWTAGNNLPGNRIAAATSGPQTSALATTGKNNTPNPSVSNLNTSYDGTNWTTETVYPLSLRQAASTGTSSSANLVAGGVGATPFGDAVTTANLWNGSAWTATGSLGTKSTHMGYAGTSTAAMICRGAQDYPSYPGVAQEYNFSAQVVTAGAWASGGALNTARRSMNTGPIGTQDAGLSAGGYTTTRVAVTEEYNGATWSNGNNTTDTLNNRGGAGSQTAGLLFGGLPSPIAVDDTEEYDGTNWTAGGALNTARGYGPIAAGTQTAALAAGGYNPPVTFVTSVEFYNGSTWATQPNTNQPNYAGASGGDQTAAWYVGAGSVSPAPPNKLTYNWDGTSWTSSGSYASSPVVNLFGGGPQTAGWMCGGDLDPGYSSSTNHYDGSVWSTAPTLGTARNYGGSGGTTTAGLIFGGFNGSNVSNTEEFTGESTSANSVDITTAE